MNKKDQKYFCSANKGIMIIVSIMKVNLSLDNRVLMVVSLLSVTRMKDKELGNEAKIPKIDQEI